MLGGSSTRNDASSSNHETGRAIRQWPSRRQAKHTCSTCVDSTEMDTEVREQSLVQRGPIPRKEPRLNISYNADLMFRTRIQSRRESSRMLILHLALFQLQLLHRRVGCQRIENHRRRVSKGVERQLQRRQRARFERDRRCQMVDLVSDMPMSVKLSSTARV